MAFGGRIGRFDSTKFLIKNRRKPFGKFGVIEPLSSSMENAAVRPEFSEKEPFSKFGAIEPPFAVIPIISK